MHTVNVMKVVVEQQTTTEAWGVYRSMFGSRGAPIGFTTNLKAALLMANRIAESENMAIEMRLEAPVGDGTTEVQSHYMYSETDVLQAILTYC